MKMNLDADSSQHAVVIATMLRTRQSFDDGARVAGIQRLVGVAPAGRAVGWRRHHHVVASHRRSAVGEPRFVSAPVGTRLQEQRRVLKEAVVTNRAELDDHESRTLFLLAREPCSSSRLQLPAGIDDDRQTIIVPRVGGNMSRSVFEADQSGRQTRLVDHMQSEVILMPEPPTPSADLSRWTRDRQSARSDAELQVGVSTMRG